jgi:hypothetical protein
MQSLSMSKEVIRNFGLFHVFFCLRLVGIEPQQENFVPISYKPHSFLMLMKLSDYSTRRSLVYAHCDTNKTSSFELLFSSILSSGEICYLINITVLF